MVKVQTCYMRLTAFALQRFFQTPQPLLHFFSSLRLVLNDVLAVSFVPFSGVLKKFLSVFLSPLFCCHVNKYRNGVPNPQKTSNTQIGGPFAASADATKPFS